MPPQTKAKRRAADAARRAIADSRAATEEPTRPRGRPTILTRELADSLAAGVAEGATLEGVAGLHGVSRVSLHNWRTKGEETEAQEGHDPDDLHVYFLNALRAAEGEFEVAMVRSIRNSSGNDAKPQQWLLERRLVERYGNRKTIDLNADVKGDKRFGCVVLGALEVPTPGPPAPAVRFAVPPPPGAPVPV